MHRAHRFLGLIFVVLLLAAALLACAGEADSPSAGAGPLDASPVHHDAAQTAPEGSVEAGSSPDATVGGGDGDDASRDAASPVLDAAIDAPSIDAGAKVDSSPP